MLNVFFALFRNYIITLYHTRAKYLTFSNKLRYKWHYTVHNFLIFPFTLYCIILNVVLSIRQSNGPLTDDRAGDVPDERIITLIQWSMYFHYTYAEHIRPYAILPKISRAFSSNTFGIYCCICFHLETTNNSTSYMCTGQSRCVQLSPSTG